MKEHNIHPTIATASYELYTDQPLPNGLLDKMNDYFKSILEFYQCVALWHEIDKTFHERKINNLVQASCNSACNKMDVDMLNINMSGMFFGKDRFGMNYKHFKFFTVEQIVHEREHSFLLEHRVVAKYD
jgi:hypothetical protein